MKIESVHFEGNNAFQAKRLYKVMVSRPSSFLNPSRYYPEVFQDDLKNIELFYRQRGYLEAHIVNSTVQEDTIEHRVHLFIQISEGERTYVEGVGIFGNQVYSDTLLHEHITIQKGDALEQKKIEKSTIHLLTLYANNGYLNAQVEPSIRVSTETHRAVIDFNILEGVQFRIAQIALTGSQKTRQKVIRRELRFRSGEIVDYSRLLESQRRLYLTGLFQSVFVHPKTAVGGDSTKKDILIELHENMSGEFNVALGFGSVEKARGKVEVFNHNLWGTARQIGLVTKLSFIGRSVEASFTEPWTFGTRWRTDVNTATEYKEEPGYNLNQVGGRIMIGRQFLKRSNLTLTYRRERVNLSDIQVRTIPGERKTNTNGLKLSLIYDTRDNLFNSTSGAYFEWSNEVGQFFSSTTKGFFRSNIQFKFFRSLSRSTVLGSSLELGWMNARSGIRSIPLHERFYAGGPNVLRGFEYQKIGPIDGNRNPLGGRLKFTWNCFEFRRTIYRMIGLTLFTDMGSVWDNPERIRMNDFRISPGIGFRVNTPIGLARLDFGINIDRNKGEPGSKLYFSMGQAF
ncbi:MAG: outer membrane protein assembly factor BamA [Gemmatimonadota bacterium]|nr:MAG: outer membrane protein assembly factor BamA [Gemmatimonadota bacterium]